MQGLCYLVVLMNVTREQYFKKVVKETYGGLRPIGLAIESIRLSIASKFVQSTLQSKFVQSTTLPRGLIGLWWWYFV